MFLHVRNDSLRFSRGIKVRNEIGVAQKAFDPLPDILAKADAK